MKSLWLILPLIVSCSTANHGHQGQTRTNMLELLAKNGEVLKHYNLSSKESIAVQRQGPKIIKWRFSGDSAEQLYIIDTTINTCISGQAVTIDCKTLEQDNDLAEFVKKMPAPTPLPRKRKR
jgi:hypothetical protein